MDEFVPGNTDLERRGRVAYERWSAVTGRTGDAWVRLSPEFRQQWCHTVEAAFEEGRAFEREQPQQPRPIDASAIAELLASTDEEMRNEVSGMWAAVLRERGYRVYDPGTWSVADTIDVTGIDADRRAR
jgi:hypothetical protein